MTKTTTFTPGQRIEYKEVGYPHMKSISATVLDTITDHQGTYILITRDDAFGLWSIKPEQVQA